MPNNTNVVPVTASAGYVKVADAASESVFIDHGGKEQEDQRVDVIFATSPPGVGDVGHELRPGQGIPRLCAGDVYAKVTRGSVSIVVSES